MTQEVVARPDAGEEVIKYFVNGEEVTHAYQKPPDRERFTLTVHEILASAGFTPVEEYELTRDGAQPIEFGERFTATFTGPTPVS